MIKMTRNISRVKITSDLQTKHELASNKYDISRTTPSWPLAKVKMKYKQILYMPWLYSNHMALNYT